jgi:hypothetical protein
LFGFQYLFFFFCKTIFILFVFLIKLRRASDNVATVCCSAAASGGEGSVFAAAECAQQVWCPQGAGAGAETDVGDDSCGGNTEGGLCDSFFLGLRKKKKKN